eukprot:g7961.t1
MSISFRVQGKKRDFTDDETNSEVCLNKKSRHTPPLNNKFHLQGCTANKIGLFITIREMFHTLDEETVANVLESCGEDVEAAIEKLEKLQLSNGGGGGEVDAAPPMGEPSSSSVHTQWMEPFLHELSQATDQEDVKLRLVRLLVGYEEAVVENFKQNSEEMKSAKNEFEMLKKNNAILAQAVASQHEKLKQNLTRDEDLEKLRQTVMQYEDRIRSLEVANYSLTMHLQKALGHNCQEHRPPDIY